MRLILLLTLILVVAAPPSRADEVRTRDGDRHTGTLKSITPTAITFGGSVRDTVVPVNEIAAVVFTPEPRGLAEARAAYDAGRYTDVFTSLNEIKPEQLRRDEAKTEVEFYRAMAAARLTTWIRNRTAAFAAVQIVAALAAALAARAVNWLPFRVAAVVSAAPAINWARFIPQELWGAVVMNAAGNPIPGCKRGERMSPVTEPGQCRRR